MVRGSVLWGTALGVLCLGGVCYDGAQVNEEGATENELAIHRIEDPDLKTIELGAVYSIHAPSTGNPWALYKIADECGIDFLEPLDIPAGWDDVYEYAIADGPIWDRIANLAHDADLAHANLEIAIVPIVDEGMATDSRALLHRFSWPY